MKKIDPFMANFAYLYWDRIAVNLLKLLKPDGGALLLTHIEYDELSQTFERKKVPFTGVKFSLRLLPSDWENLYLIILGNDPLAAITAFARHVYAQNLLQEFSGTSVDSRRLEIVHARLETLANRYNSSLPLPPRTGPLDPRDAETVSRAL